MLIGPLKADILKGYEGFEAALHRSLANAAPSRTPSAADLDHDETCELDAETLPRWGFERSRLGSSRWLPRLPAIAPDGASWFLHAGLLGAGGLLGAPGLSLAEVLRAESESGMGRRPNSVIILWMRGGPSHIDMWDPKPEAPVEYRGEFGTIPTNVPGVFLSDMLPKCAALMDKWSIVRSLNHHDAGHSTGDQICFTGYNSGPMADENIHPSCGSIVAEQLGHLSPDLPPYVMIPRMVPGTNAAYLGVANKPFETLSDPATKGPFKVPNFELAEGLSSARLGDRQGLLKDFDRLRREADARGQIRAVDRFQQQAWISSPVRRRDGRSTSMRSRRKSASATASSRRSIPARRTVAVLPPGANGCCSRGGWWRRGCGWSPSTCAGGTRM